MSVLAGAPVRGVLCDITGTSIGYLLTGDSILNLLGSFWGDCICCITRALLYQGQLKNNLIAKTRNGLFETYLFRRNGRQFESSDYPGLFRYLLLFFLKTSVSSIRPFHNSLVSPMRSFYDKLMTNSLHQA